jgi:hypothetical protein
MGRFNGGTRRGAAAGRGAEAMEIGAFQFHFRDLGFKTASNNFYFMVILGIHNHWLNEIEPRTHASYTSVLIYTIPCFLLLRD